MQVNAPPDEALYRLSVDSVQVSCHASCSGVVFGDTKWTGCPVVTSTLRWISRVLTQTERSLNTGTLYRRFQRAQLTVTRCIETLMPDDSLQLIYDYRCNWLTIPALVRLAPGTGARELEN